MYLMVQDSWYAKYEAYLVPVFKFCIQLNYLDKIEMSTNTCFQIEVAKTMKGLSYFLLILLALRNKKK